MKNLSIGAVAVLDVEGIDSRDSKKRAIRIYTGYARPYAGSVRDADLHWLLAPRAGELREIGSCVRSFQNAPTLTSDTNYASCANCTGCAH